MNDSRLKNYCGPTGMLSHLEHFFDGCMFCVQTVFNMAISNQIVKRHCRKCAELVDFLNDIFPSKHNRLWPIITPFNDENTRCEPCKKKMEMARVNVQNESYLGNCLLLNFIIS